MFKFRYDESNRNKFPVGSFFLMGLFYLIGILTYKEGSLPSIESDFFARNIIVEDIRAQFSLVPVFEWQWQIFTYGFIHFGLVHYAYVGLLLFYYAQGLEKATSSRFVVISFFILSAMWPIVMGIAFFAFMDILPASKEWILTYDTYLGSSVGAWGLIGLSVTSGYKRKLFWVDILILLIIEFALKIMKHDDVTSNITHVFIFIFAWFFAWKFIEIENNTGNIGGMSSKNKIDVLLAILIIIHALGMVFYFTYKLGIT
ncbi:MAG: rhomboid family intramembrane serine protease [Candidatus Heimdallarchaeota archaeon]|nr:rhomboid family intramembrane serine protease [Candidatus Heimdallarchaeota archaeon]MCK5048324.1 rhomboid family intramembrane serine protease [Candidatus Heimdallarchaeota archaeon]